jgi:beta-N-acetylhexosaminidase
MGLPAWRAIPPAGQFAALTERDESLALEATWINARLMASELSAVGINVNCTPVLDVPTADCHAIIGDRAYGRTPEQVALLGQAVASGLIAGGVLPVIKHLPGHGRARVDSHVSLPRVEADLETLRAIDFAPFVALAAQPCGMTAHVIYEAIDNERPATLSEKVIQGTIRDEIEFQGLLFSDDLCMGALSGKPGEKAKGALNAGCDIVLHCNADFAEMEGIARVCPPVSAAAAERINQAKAIASAPCEMFDAKSAFVRLQEIFA